MEIWKTFILIGTAAFICGCTDSDIGDGLPTDENTAPETEVEPEPLPPLSESKLKEDGFMGVLVGIEHGTRLGDLYSNTTTLYNMPLFDVKKLGATEAEWWDNLAEELAYCGVDYAALNCRGWLPNEAVRIDHGDPHLVKDMIEAMQRKGVGDKFKIAIFDDSPASWMAARSLNLYNKYTSAVLSLKDFENYDPSRYPEKNLQPKPTSDEQLVYPIDNLNPDDPLGCYYYIWTCNIKLAFANFYGENQANNKYLFKYKGRPVLYLWTLNGFLAKGYPGLGSKRIDCTGKLKAIILKMKEDFRREFGEELFVIPDRAWEDLDPEVCEPGVADAMNVWFSGVDEPGRLYADGKSYLLNDHVYTGKWIHKDNYLYEKDYIKVGTGIPGFSGGDLKDEHAEPLDPDHGRTLSTSLDMFTTVQNGLFPNDPNRDGRADLIFLEGFTDVLENAAFWRSVDTKFYDYPNQRLNILRRYSHYPFQYVQKLEAEACDFYQNPKVFPNKRMNIMESGKVTRCDDKNYGGGWCVEGLRVNDRIQWKELPFREGSTAIKFRYAYSISDVQLEITVGDTSGGIQKKTVTLPASPQKDKWVTKEIVRFDFEEKGYHDLTIRVLSGIFDLNYIHLIANDIP